MDLASLKSSRGSRKGHIDRLIAEMDQHIADNSLPGVEAALTKLEVKEFHLLKVFADIESTATGAEVATEVAAQEIYHDVILDAKIRANRYLKQQAAIAAAAAAAAAPPVQPLGATAQQYPAQQYAATRTTAKLPKLQIPKFDGNIADFERFWAQFESGIHINPTLSKVDKFNYLLSLLTEKARLSLKGLSLTEVNYDVAVRNIQDKYGKKELLVDEHLRQLSALKHVSQLGNGQELRLMYEEFLGHTQSLEALGKDLSTMSTTLCYTLRQALPKSLLIEWNRKTSGKHNDDLPLIMDFVKCEVEGLEAACKLVAEHTKSQAPKKEGNFTPAGRTSSTLVATDSSSGNNNTQQKFAARSSSAPMPYCYFCDEQNTHFSSSCPVYTTNKSRRESIARAKRCFKCFRRGHQSRSCEQHFPCKICSNPHHTLLCEQREVKQRSQTGTGNKPHTANRKQETTTTVVTEDTHTEPQTLVASSASTHIKGSKQVSILQTMRVWIRCGPTTHPVTILLDGGSQRSFILSSTARSLNLPIHSQEETTIHSFGGNRMQQKAPLVEFVLESYNGVALPMKALQVPTICQGITLWESAQIESYLQDRRIHTWNQKMGPGELVNIDVLIGVDYYWKIVTGHMKRLSDSLMATQTIFGWMLQGTADAHTPVKPIVTMFTTYEDSHTPEPTVQQQLSQLWELDRSGIMLQEEKSPLQLEDVEVLKNFEQTITYQEGRYQVGVPWNHNKHKLKSNFEVAKERLRRMLWRLSKDPVLYERYKTGVFEYLKNGHSEEVSLSEHNPILFYMPHHAIIKEDRKTTKVRIVFDGSSCEVGGESLNTCQHTGPSLNPPIFNLLLRFRWDAVAMVSDIEKAFLQISVRSEDRDALRFLWTDKPWKKDEEPKLQVFRMSRVLFGMKSSPFLLAATIRYHARTHPTSDAELSQYIDERIYVDDLLSGSKDSHTAHALFTRIFDLFMHAGMKLTKWVTNNDDLRQQWIQEGITSSTETVELLKVLGLLWDPTSDNFAIRSTNILTAVEKDTETKRSMLKILASIFDPLGFLAPITITVKKMLQDLWKLKVGWDEHIPEAMQEEWKSWKDELRHLAQVQIPRWLRTGNNTSYQLHIFCDAGPRVYAAVVYIRFLEGSGVWSSQLVTSKARLAPINLISIPRLELMACLIGSRLAVSILQTYNQVHFSLQFWSDSKVALQWVADVPSRWKLFVGRRVQEIQANTPPDGKWSYCPTKNNIADILTRGQDLSQLNKNLEWWLGPHWLRLPEEDWNLPQTDISSSDQQELLREAQVTEVSTHLVTTVGLNPLIDEEKYSTWRKLVRVTAWVLRFVQNCRAAARNLRTYLEYQEIQAAELHWFQHIQKLQFPEELEALTKQQELSKHSPIHQFNPFLDDQHLIRLGGRLQFAHLTTEQQHPILLRPGGLTELLIQDRHCKTLHGGVQSTLAKLRDQVWILRGRQSVRKAIYGCMVCRKWNAKPATEIEAQLPAARVQQATAFQISGIDFAGPLMVKNGATKTKAYICLFTCAVTRAIHLELVSSQSLQHFLLAFRRFVARRGGCKLVYSDNGATFHQADALLRESYGHLFNSTTQELATKLGIEWRFISPRASWWGGFYERLVQSVKYHLRRSLGAALLTAEELSTLLSEIEAVLNNRPLLPLTEDATDKPYITPSHFLLGKTTDNLCDSLEYVVDNPSRQKLFKRWRYKKQLMTKFWTSWRKEYLMQLRTAHEVKTTASKQDPVKLNDVVLVTEDRLPRGQWKMATVVDLTLGRDGKVRSVMLRLSDQKLMRRAVQHICPLEVL